MASSNRPWSIPQRSGEPLAATVRASDDAPAPCPLRTGRACLATASSASWDAAAWVSSTSPTNWNWAGPWPSRWCCPAARRCAGELARFKAEAEAVARLQHPNVVQIYAVGQFEGRPYLALEFCSGASLEWCLAGKPLPPYRAAALVETLARAIQHAHERGIVHRDLKPANILLALSDACAEAFFAPTPRRSLAHRLRAQDQRLRAGPAPRPATGIDVQRRRPGNPQLHGARAGPCSHQPPDARCDVYALGALLYELVTGRPPFLGESVLDTLQQVVRDEPVAPTRVQPGCPHDLETIVLKCLRKEPQRRYATALDLAEDCASFLRGEPIRARTTPPWERAAKWWRRRPAAAALLAVLVLTVVGLAGAGLWHTAELRATAVSARAQEKAALEAAQLSRSRVEAQALLLTAGDFFARSLGGGPAGAGEALVLLDSRTELMDLTHQAKRLAVTVSSG